MIFEDEARALKVGDVVVWAGFTIGDKHCVVETYRHTPTAWLVKLTGMAGIDPHNAHLWCLPERYEVEKGVAFPRIERP